MNEDVIRLLLDHVRSRRFGKYRGTVISNTDPLGKGRLQVSVPGVLPPQLSQWAMPCVPYAGNQVGLFGIPAVGAGVWVEFEGGDISYPIWVGCFWGDNEAPQSANPDIKMFKTEKLGLVLNDSSQTITLRPDSGATVTLTTDAVTTAGQAKHSVTTNGVTSEITPNKTELTSTSFSVNGGALQVT